MSFLKKILTLFQTETPNSNLKDKDELLGIWENDLDDGSGLHAIWGWSFRFMDDGTGMHYYWVEGELQYNMTFNWLRINESTIKIKFKDETEWSIINYSLEKIDGPYNTKLLRLTDSNYVPCSPSEIGFWNFHGALFRHV
ncbi:MAG: hypothetical protein K1X55_14060 [Chitinophagales bacterium]|nr:hypothetical protein [Chitinophagales bacterium]